MRAITIILLVGIISSCSSTEKKDSGAKKILTDSIKTIVSFAYSNVADLPFGDSLLVKDMLPEYWKTPIYSDNMNIKPNKYEKTLASIGNFYNHIAGKKIGQLPKIEKIERLELKKDNYCKCSELLQPDSFNIQLPDIGIYKCYYVSNTSYYNQKLNELCMNTCRAYGYIFLLDSTSHVAKSLPVYYEGNGESYSAFRYFYLNKNGSVKIFEGRCYDNECSLKLTTEILLSKDGEIKIDTIK